MEIGIRKNGQKKPYEKAEISIFEITSVHVIATSNGVYGGGQGWDNDETENSFP